VEARGERDAVAAGPAALAAEALLALDTPDPEADRPPPGATPRASPSERALRGLRRLATRAAVEPGEYAGTLSAIDAALHKGNP
jgi:hypothetical protein